MADIFDFKCDIDGLSQYVQNLEKATNDIQRKAMSKGGQYIASQVRSNYKSYFPNPARHHDKTGMKGYKKGEPENLRKSIRNRAYAKPKLGQIIYTKVHAYNPYSPEQPNVLYGAALAKGFTATAKNDKYLTFQADGKWHKVKSVTVAARPFVTEPSERASKSQEIVRRMEGVIQKEIEKQEQKAKAKLK